MNINLENKTFIVCGATSGFGHAVADRIIQEGGSIYAIARTEEKLRELKDAYNSQVEILTGDITQSDTIHRLVKTIASEKIHGILINAGGPPAMTFIETKLKDWDEAYQTLLRWKVELTKALLPKFIEQKYGRFLFIESASVKQPLENLVLSTSLRLSVVGFVKTLSQEMPDKGVTFNIMAPGYHYTQAVERLIRKKAEMNNLTLKKAREEIESAIPMKTTGDVDKFASLAVWLLSPLSEYVTGQVYAVDGGVIKSTL
ncbi:MAG: SDR family oxidoreductase [Bacteroidales bacterium]|nr:SDR family oxidoreductase [Bacteroidales bacterium]